MKITIHQENKVYEANLSEPLDISIPIQEGLNNVNCFYAPPVEVWPVRAGDFVGSTTEGGLLNFMNVKINPHGNGTHTECVGHIAKEKFSINQSLQNFHFLANLVSIYPRKTENGDRIIFRDQLEEFLKDNTAEALIIRTLPNDYLKQQTNYSGANPPYLHHEAVQ